MHKFILIGVTGKIASGKSLIMKYLNDKGYKTFSADMAVKDLYNYPEIQKKIEELIGCSPINKEKLGEIIFGDEIKRKTLENFIHPLVRNQLEEFTKLLDNNEVGFAEVPLLYESEMGHYFDCIIFIDCDKDIRSARALNRGISLDKFNIIDKIQSDDKNNKFKANFIIDSNVNIEILKNNIDKIIGKINERNNT